MRKPSKSILITFAALIAIATALIVPTAVLARTFEVELVPSNNVLAGGTCRNGTICVDEVRTNDGMSWIYDSCCVNPTYVGSSGITCAMVSRSDGRFDGPI